MQKTKGFTIIELIVVVAIIAVLAAIVSINVISYLNKGKNAAIKENLNTAQATMAGMIEASTTFTGACTTTTADLYKAYTAATTAAGTATGSTCVTTGAVGGTGCVCVKLLAEDNNWCVDSAGGKGAFASATTCATECADNVCDGNGT